MAWQNNTAELCGTVDAPGAFSHRSRGVDYYSFPLLTCRLSGAEAAASASPATEEKDNLVTQKVEESELVVGRKPGQEAGEIDDLSDVKDIFDFLLGKPDSGSDDQKEG